MQQLRFGARPSQPACLIAGLACTAVSPTVALARADASADDERFIRMAATPRPSNGQIQVAAFREHLQKLGWTEASNLRIDLRFGAGDPVRIREWRGSC